MRLFGRHTSPLDGYQRLQRLGGGSEGETWLARDLSLQRLVTLKRLHNRGVHLDQSSRQRSLMACASLTHPSIARVYSTVNQGADLWVVAEYVAGISLPAPGILTGYLLTQLALDLAEALQGVHAAGVVHGDIAPNNIVIDTTGRARLLDFGIARIAGDLGTGAGTPGFVAPEVSIVKPVTVQQDAYSVGALIFWLLSGQLPEYLNDSEGERLQVLPTLPNQLVWPAEALWQTATALVAIAPADRPPMPELVAVLRELMRGFPDDPRQQLQRFLLTEHRLTDAGLLSLASVVTDVDAEQIEFDALFEAEPGVSASAMAGNNDGVVTEAGTSTSTSTSIRLNPLLCAGTSPRLDTTKLPGADTSTVAMPRQSASNHPRGKLAMPTSTSFIGDALRQVRKAARFLVALRRPMVWASLTLPLIMLTTGMMLREPPLSTLDLQRSRVDMQPGAKPSAHLTPLWLDQVLQGAVKAHWLLDDANSEEQLAVTVRCRGSWCQVMMAHDQTEIEHWHQTTLPVTSAPALWRGALTDLVNTAAAE